MPTLQQPLMIVTDLDGSLLDHHSYRWDAAVDWLDQLQQHQIPLVICTSKTAAEILPLQKKLGISGAPFIAENGALVQLNASERVRIPPESLSYEALHQLLLPLKKTYRFSTFYDFTDREVSAMTGLTETDSALSRQRDATEVLVWRDSDDAFDAFRNDLLQHNLDLTQGGRFWHVMPAGSGKGEALRWLLSQQQETGRITIGLGDGPNDAPMLDAVDYAVVIKGYSKTPVRLTRQDQQHIFHTAHYGPEGWCEGLDYFLT
ncbi:mannosyl-3-phosphoglycerate phosphatase-related protein [Pantoea sp. LMR881]|uniref:mannosyl-3-phosphoglycerate phosphatase-related protein n=1 Tax=Pantoea sp. LMR881 TaxID=3014336 RepID=UPI0022AF019C|nr:mannosyl-3-phosphoglycerate phosphatase-related protein [Pantoea sp. LMR881]MCZ4058114.1 mannosyl-3-phosphoglycerate phosphatase-related protein [Pantoea sp. LMR881]